MYDLLPVIDNYDEAKLKPYILAVIKYSSLSTKTKLPTKKLRQTKIKDNLSTKSQNLSLLG